MLSSLFPELNIPAPKKPKFSLFRGYWQDTLNQRTFLEKAASKLGIKYPQDWSYVSIKQIAQLGGSSLIRRYGSLTQALRALYPDQRWNSWRFSQTTPHDVLKGKARFSKMQYTLFQYIQKVSCVLFE